MYMDCVSMYRSHGQSAKRSLTTSPSSTSHVAIHAMYATMKEAAQARFATTLIEFAGQRGEGRDDMPVLASCQSSDGQGGGGGGGKGESARQQPRPLLPFRTASWPGPLWGASPPPPLPHRPDPPFTWPRSAEFTVLSQLSGPQEAEYGGSGAADATPAFYSHLSVFLAP